jgi:hypothetical protein
MSIIKSFSWKRRVITPDELRKARSITNVVKVKPIVPGLDVNQLRSSDVCLITGDSKCLADHLKEFEAWGVPHDVYAVNRSLLMFQRPVQHWAAVDNEEAAWFMEYAGTFVDPQNIAKHTIGTCGGFDVFWEMDIEEENPHHKDLWPGNTGYFAILTALYMGYKKIIVAGMPLDRSPHFYDEEGADGPCWIGATYTQWMDFKMQIPEADKVRSMGGYSAFILGKADRSWL